MEVLETSSVESAYMEKFEVQLEPSFQRYLRHQLAHGRKLVFQANSVMEDKFSEKIINSLDNILNTALCRNNTIESLFMYNKNIMTHQKHWEAYYHHCKNSGMQASGVWNQTTGQAKIGDGGG